MTITTSSPKPGHAGSRAIQLARSPRAKMQAFRLLVNSRLGWPNAYDDVGVFDAAGQATSSRPASQIEAPPVPPPLGAVA